MNTTSSNGIIILTVVLLASIVVFARTINAGCGKFCKILSRCR